jgi:NADH-quinone oxidoreductase subunit J
MAELWQQVVFWAFAVMITGAGIGVVTSRNVVHAALWLVGALMGAAAMYVLLFAEFVAWVQVLIYVGAIVVLMLFGLMLTRAPIGSANFDNNQRPLAALCSVSVFVVSAGIILTAFEGREVNFARTAGITTESVGASLFSAFVLPFEVVSILLLAALVGAIVIARRD